MATWYLSTLRILHGHAQVEHEMAWSVCSPSDCRSIWSILSVNILFLIFQFVHLASRASAYCIFFPCEFVGWSRMRSTWFMIEVRTTHRIECTNKEITHQHHTLQWMNEMIIWCVCFEVILSSKFTRVTCTGFTKLIETQTTVCGTVRLPFFVDKPTQKWIKIESD